jgi:hypothetical protein
MVYYKPIGGSNGRDKWKKQKEDDNRLKNMSDEDRKALGDVAEVVMSEEQLEKIREDNAQITEQREHRRFTRDERGEIIDTFVDKDLMFEDAEIHFNKMSHLLAIHCKHIVYDVMEKELRKYKVLNGLNWLRGCSIVIQQNEGPMTLAEISHQILRSFLHMTDFNLQTLIWTYLSVFWQKETEENAYKILQHTIEDELTKELACLEFWDVSLLRELIKYDVQASESKEVPMLFAIHASFLALKQNIVLVEWMADWKNFLKLWKYEKGPLAQLVPQACLASHTIYRHFEENPDDLFKTRALQWQHHVLDNYWKPWSAWGAFDYKQNDKLNEPNYTGKMIFMPDKQMWLPSLQDTSIQVENEEIISHLPLIEHLFERQHINVVFHLIYCGWLKMLDTFEEQRKCMLTYKTKQTMSACMKLNGT